MATVAGTRKKKPKNPSATIESGAIIPSELADRWDLIVKEAGRRIFHKRKAMKEAIGVKPYRGIPIENNEFMKRWSEIRKDPMALTELLTDNAKFKPDGRVLMSKELLKKITETEAKLRAGGFVEEPA